MASFVRRRGYSFIGILTSQRLKKFAKARRYESGRTILPIHNVHRSWLLFPFATEKVVAVSHVICECHDLRCARRFLQVPKNPLGRPQLEDAAAYLRS